jgi:hypothetical protein
MISDDILKAISKYTDVGFIMALNLVAKDLKK